MSKWIEEELEPGLRVSYGLKEQLNSSRSKFQTVDVVDLAPFGRTLLIDGLIQSCQVDEYVYHESLVHPALLSHSCPKSVYIGGGGEGSTAREVLRHTTVERCVMVDIDADVVKFCKENLPENAEAFADPRLELVIDDAKAVLEQSATGFDVIIMDLDDPLEDGPCYQLYTEEFYTMCKRKLNPGGVFVTQSGQAGVKRHHLVWSPVNSTLRQVFPAVRAYNQAVYSFMDEWGWNMAFVDGDMGTLLEPDQVDDRIARRIKGELRFLDGESYKGLFCLSKAHRKTLAEEKRVLSREKGTFSFMHSQGLCIAGAKS
uniref:thermospermine synthase n=2 Tax=Haptolina brevifila TaxID=156173 RepID=A0A7S2NR58_9EUKA